MNKYKYVYVGQYGTVWKLPWAEWIAIAKSCAREDSQGYQLPSKFALKTIPRALYRVKPDPDRYHRTNKFGVIGDVMLVEPLDWEPEAFREWLQHYAPDELQAKDTEK